MSSPWWRKKKEESSLKRRKKGKEGDVEEKDRGDKKEGKNGKLLFLYIQMQLCLKETLKDWLRDDQSRHHAMVLDIFGQIVDAVQFLHSRALIHRDLKPSNIFFSAADGTVKIGDFGLVTATALEEAQDSTPVFSPLHFSASSTRQHTDQVGTKLYMSPEQVSGGSYCQKVDIYALGIVFFELLVPFATEMERGRTLMTLRRDSQVPDSLKRVKIKESGLVLQMIHSDPSERPTAEAVKEVIEELESDQSNAEDAESPGSKGRRRRRSSFSRGSSRNSRSSGGRKSGPEDNS